LKEKEPEKSTLRFLREVPSQSKLLPPKLDNQAGRQRIRTSQSRDLDGNQHWIEKPKLKPTGKLLETWYGYV
jgi:hypothetical protein